ncbi:hypothetical protein RHMOL_Rhmol03G0117300 [Rhododendron molle]|uniref:Uncharacterized protein n=1 Tax=Rhododendron molle TaxID=49168 RepID=A0ACC0PEG8_RHOML|nr:hypothetical protein RHMOL_Rhmol03G0117300 [Rhododendron molle]
MTPQAMLSFSWSHHSSNKMALELASPHRGANATGPAAEEQSKLSLQLPPIDGRDAKILRENAGRRIA